MALSGTDADAGRALYSPIGGDDEPDTDSRGCVGAAHGVHRQSEPDQTRPWGGGGDAGVRTVVRRRRGNVVHDFDYQQNSTEETHLHVGTGILRERGWPEEWVRIVASHADYMGVPRDSRAAKTLFAVDELSGFLTACALVRPDKAIAEVKVKSVKKKLKDKAFARGVNRDDVRVGAEQLEVDLGEHIEFVRDAMATISDRLELPPAE